MIEFDHFHLVLVEEALDPVDFFDVFHFVGLEVLVIEVLQFVVLEALVFSQDGDAALGSFVFLLILFVTIKDDFCIFLLDFYFLRLGLLFILTESLFTCTVRPTE